MKLDCFEFQTGLFFTGRKTITIKSQQIVEASDDEVETYFKHVAKQPI